MLTRGTLLYIAQRLALIVFTLIAVSFLVFVTVHTLPGNAFESDRVHGRALQLLLHQYGLDQPILVQYWNFLTQRDPRQPWACRSRYAACRSHRS